MRYLITGSTCLNLPPHPHLPQATPICLLLLPKSCLTSKHGRMGAVEQASWVGPGMAHILAPVPMLTSGPWNASSGEGAHWHQESGMEGACLPEVGRGSALGARNPLTPTPSCSVALRLTLILRWHSRPQPGPGLPLPLGLSQPWGPCPVAPDAHSGCQLQDLGTPVVGDSFRAPQGLSLIHISEPTRHS